MIEHIDMGYLPTLFLSIYKENYLELVQDVYGEKELEKLLK